MAYFNEWYNVQDKCRGLVDDKLVHTGNGM